LPVFLPCTNGNAGGRASGVAVKAGCWRQNSSQSAATAAAGAPLPKALAMAPVIFRAGDMRGWWPATASGRPDRADGDVLAFATAEAERGAAYCSPLRSPLPISNWETMDRRLVASAESFCVAADVSSTMAAF